MNVLTKAALTALLASSIGVADLMPSYAGSATPDTTTTPPAQTQPSTMPHPGGMWRGWGEWHGHHPMFGRHGGSWLMRLACSDRGGEALEIAFVRLKYALNLTPTQQPLFDALRSAALSNQKSFADTCEAATETGVPPGQRTLLDRLQTELALDSAKVTALSDIVPKFKALYDSLSDEQKTQFQQMRPHRGHFGPWGGWGHQQRPGWHHGMMPGWHPGASGTTPPAPNAAPGVPNPPAPAAPATPSGQS